VPGRTLRARSPRPSASTRATGLPPEEAARRLDLSRPNELVERARKPPWRLLAEQFGNTMIVVLLVAAGITAAVGD
jgi:magnesium-transporting ATPase (P-type)